MGACEYMCVCMYVRVCTSVTHKEKEGEKTLNENGAELSRRVAKGPSTSISLYHIRGLEVLGHKEPVALMLKPSQRGPVLPVLLRP